MYVGNRVARIVKLVSPDRWRHMTGTDNPAYCASRSLFPSELLDHELVGCPELLTSDHVGIDYAGPATGMSVSLPLNYQSIKAVHPELVSDLTIQMLLLQKVAVELGPDHLPLRVPA